MSATNHTVPSTPSQPVGLSDGFHCSDLGTSAGIVDPTIAAVQSQALASMKTWLATWKPTKAQESSKGTYIPAAKVGQGSANKAQPRPEDTKPINAFAKEVGTL